MNVEPSVATGGAGSNAVGFKKIYTQLAILL